MIGTNYRKGGDYIFTPKEKRFLWFLKVFGKSARV
jgi:hypothetical protein